MKSAQFNHPTQYSKQAIGSRQIGLCLTPVLHQLQVDNWMTKAYLLA